MANVNLKDSMFLWHMSIRTNNEANVMKPNSKETFARTELARKVVWQGFVVCNTSRSRSNDEATRL